MKVSEALEYLVGTDERYGKLKASAKYYADFKVKKVKGAEILRTSQGSSDKREAEALQTNAVQEVYLEKLEIDTEMETISAKRKTAELTIEVWRSQQANRRAGNI